MLFCTITHSAVICLMPFYFLPLLPFRHFLFKTGTGTTPFFGAAAPGYTMATGTVYSTPARPLPRNTLSRGAFKFKKSPKHCSWKCTALIAVGIAVVLSIILCYCIGKTEITLHEHPSLTDIFWNKEHSQIKTLWNIPKGVFHHWMVISLNWTVPAEDRRKYFVHEWHKYFWN